MLWIKNYSNISQYEYAGSNQHGNRYKRSESKRIATVRMSTDCNNIADMRTLILLSHNLDVPVHYDYEDSRAYIEVVSKEVL